MKSIHYIIYMALAALSFTACQEEDFGSGAKGGIRISLMEDVGVDVSTRSTPTELGKPLVAEFKIEVKNSAGNNKYSGKLPDNKEIPLDAGSYDVIAYYGTNETLALDSPYYEGSKEAVEVKDGYTTPVELTCKVANALLSIQINEDDKKKFDEVFKTPSFQLTVGGKSVATSDITKSFYFKAGSTISKLAFSKDGSDYQDLGIKNWPKEIKAADHIIVTVGIEPAPSGVSLTVSKVDVVPVTITETIPMEWLPKPSVSATGFDANNSLTFAETETKNAKLDLKLASALQDIKFKFNFEDKQFSSLTKEEYVWSNEEDKKVISEQLSINVLDKSVDLNGLLAKLQTNAGATTTNTIEVDVKANDRWSSEDKEANHTYTIICNKPQFSIAVQPGNVWTKTFTIDEPTVTAGNLETIKSKLKYQYKTGNGEWQDCNQSVQFNSAPTEKNYQVRAIYRDVIASDEVTVTLETPAQLPNSDMEEWSYTNDKTGSLTGHTYYTYYPYQNGLSDKWWTTNNERSQDGVKAGYLSYKGCFSPCVSYNENIKHGDNRSALIYTSGHGGGYASIATELYEEGAFAGSLFIGQYNWNRDNNPMETITTGHTFSSRPTSFKFWYKYVPKNSDAFKVYIELKNGDEIVASGTFVPETISSETGWIAKSIDLDYGDSPKAATSIYVQFLSTIKTSFAESDFDKNKSITFPVMGDWNAHIGSMLYIDDLSLIYDK